MVLARQIDQAFARFRLDIGGVDDGQLSGRQALAGDEVQDLERVLRRRLVVFVIGHQAAAIVRRDDFGGKEVLARKRRLAGTGRTDQQDEGKLGQG